MKKKLLSLLLALTLCLSLLPLSALAEEADADAGDSPTTTVDGEGQTGEATPEETSVPTEGNEGQTEPTDDPTTGGDTGIGGEADQPVVETEQPVETDAPIQYDFTIPNAPGDVVQVATDRIGLTEGRDYTAENTDTGEAVIHLSSDGYGWAGLNRSRYLSVVFSDGSEAIFNSGDVNTDGVINGKDVTVLFQYVNKLRSSIPNPIMADVNKDNKVDAEDITQLVPYINKRALFETTAYSETTYVEPEDVDSTDPGAVRLSVALDKQSLYPGETVTFTISVSNAKDAGIGGLYFNLVLPYELSIVSTPATGYIEGVAGELEEYTYRAEEYTVECESLLSVNDFNPNERNIFPPNYTFFTTGASTLDGVNEESWTVMTITCKLAEDAPAGDYTVSIANVLLYDASEAVSDIPHSRAAATVTAVQPDENALVSFVDGNGQAVTAVRADGTPWEEGVTLSVTPVDKAEVPLSDAVKEKYGIEDYTVYDISLLKDNVAVQPDGSVAVTLPVPEDCDGSKCVVFRVEDSGVLTALKTIFENGVLTFITGHFSTYLVAEAEVPAVRKGDVNGDEDVNAKDVTALFQFVNKQTSSLKNPDAADVNGDETVDAKDVTRLFQFVNKQIETLEIPEKL